MTIQRLRPAHTPERLAELYAAPHDPSTGIGHDVRLFMTQVFASRMVLPWDRDAVADLSCGGSTIADDLANHAVHLGDMAVLPAERFAETKHCGPIEQTIDQIPEVDLFVCTETLEHLNNPALVLAQIRGKARRLLLSTPVNNWFDREANEEHYWAWDRMGVEMLAWQTNWHVEAYMELDLRPLGGWYEYGVWVLR
jgi:hypothetical protein